MFRKEDPYMKNKSLDEEVFDDQVKACVKQNIALERLPPSIKRVSQRERGRISFYEALKKEYGERLLGERK